MAYRWTKLSFVVWIASGVLVVAVAALFVWMKLISPVLPPRPDSPVSDYAKIIDAETEKQITILSQTIWDQFRFALVVVTVPTLGRIQNIDEYAKLLYNKWGIGDKNANEGALVLVSLSPRQVRIEVGKGSEVYLKDNVCGEILDDSGIPCFKKNDFSQGLFNVSQAIVAEVAKERRNAFQEK